MSHSESKIHRSIDEPIRENLSWAEKWNSADQGLIIAWEVGRELAQKNPELSERARKGELPLSGWKGGVEKKIQGRKYGTLRYLAEWQGLRGEDLDIDLGKEIELTCSRTGVTVIYSGDIKKYGG